MIRALTPVAPLLLGVAILLTGQGLQGTLLPVRATLEGFSTFSIGLMGGAYFLGFTLGCLRGSVLVRRVGHIRVFAAMTALASASPLLHGLILEVWLWMVLRLISGYCFAVLYVVIESWLNEKATNENRGLVFSAYTLITLTVLAAGQMLLLLRDPREMALFAIASAIVSIAALPVALFVVSTPAQPETRIKLDIRRLWKVSRAGLLGCLAAGLANGSFWALAPVFVAGYHADISLAAWFMTAAVIGGALGQWPLGRLSDRVDRRWVIAACALAGVLVGLALWLFAGVSLTIMMLLSATWGAVAFPIYAVSVAQANDNANSDEYVMVSSGLLLMYGIGAIVGPFLAPAAMQLTGPGGLYLFAALVHVILGTYVLLRIPRHAQAPEEEHLPFADSLASTQTASVVYEDELESDVETQNEAGAERAA